MSKPPRLQTAVKWAFVMSWGPSAIASLLTFILAMYLGPRDYGLVAMAAIYIAFNKLFMEGGLGAAIVQRKNLDPEHLDAVFWLTTIFSIFLMCATWLISPLWVWVNSLFNQNAGDIGQLQIVLNVLACVMPIQGLTVVQESLLEKQMDFKSLAIRSNVAALIGGTFGFSLAIKGYGVWALVGEDLLVSGVRVILLWRLGKWRPSFRFSWRHLKELYKFSLFVMVGEIGSFVQRRSDAILIGVFFGPKAVGIYRLADRLINMIIEMATRPFVLVVLPNFSRLQDDMPALQKSVSNCLRASTMMTMPILAMMAGLSYHICATLSARGQNWDAAVNVIQVLALVGSARAVTLFTGPLVQSINRPRLFMAMSWGLAAMNTIGFCTAGYLLRDTPGHEIDARTQALGVASARAFVFCMIYTPLCLTIVARICHLRYGDIFRSMLPAIITAGAVFALGVVVDRALLRHLPDHNVWLRLATLCIGASITMGLALFLMFRLEPRVRDFILNRFRKKRSGGPSVAMATPAA